MASLLVLGTLASPRAVFAQVDLRYEATLTATDLDYQAINWFIQATGPGCEPPSEYTLSRSTEQRMTVQSEPVVLHVVDAPSVDFLHYSLAAVPDRLRDLWGLSQRFLEDPDDTALAMPVTIRVSRSIDSPASGEEPPVKSFGPESCSDNEPTEVIPPDCGERSFRAWMAMVQQGLESLRTGNVPVPMHMGALGGAPARLDGLYKNCPGPLPWPGSLTEDPDATVVNGTLPSNEDIQRVAREWTSDHKAGRFDITGTAHRNTSEVGRLRNHSYSWTLTLCPMDKDGATPPGCP
jgi:hypothetical protein